MPREFLSQGPHGALILNIAKPWAKSVGVDYSKKMGPVLTYQAQPSKRVSNGRTVMVSPQFAHKRPA